MNALRIALISEHASPLALAGGVDAGGQNVYVAHIARCLAAAGHHVDVLTRRDDAAQPTIVDMRPGVRVLHIDAGPPRFVPKEQLLEHMPAFIEAATQLFAHSEPYDLLHANFFMSGLVGLALKRRFELPLVTTFHALGLVRRQHQREADLFPPARIAIERALVRESDRVIAECPQDQSDLMRLYEADARRIACIPCGVDTRELRPGDKRRARQRLGLAADEFIVLQLGRMVPRKGVANVIAAMAELPPALSARLLVVGGGSREPDEQASPEIGRLRGIARGCGVADRVEFVGRRERQELRDFYVAADVFVTTPWYEPFGITPLEAMACATPVIGSAVGGIKHTVLDGVTGLLVPPEDPPALAARLLDLQANPALAAAMGRAGVRRVRSLFTWERVSQQLLDVYAALAQGQEAVPLAARLLREGGQGGKSGKGVVVGLHS
ncbi:glycosyltransferase family 4 protein [Roseateles violae]|uniref:Glycosyltransferase family 1 protein n=1 Tax=Roseateles violae TaxID=3058042 RepID=A0ABT8DXQ7_9BURK|nr:glycosyltransferase family 1 protein [Pelomonas sp. PFR6]MDN3922350.1 glycosyltransferase family 1 protein [Pelomonas sp. PFR6]